MLTLEELHVDMIRNFIATLLFLSVLVFFVHLSLYQLQDFLLILPKKFGSSTENISADVLGTRGTAVDLKRFQPKNFFSLSALSNRTNIEKLTLNMSAEQKKRIDLLRKGCKQYSNQFYSGLLYKNTNFTSLPYPLQKRLAKSSIFQKFNLTKMKRLNDTVLHAGYSIIKGLSFIPSSNHYLCSGKYEFCVCIVPKSGSTFWFQVFQVIGRRKHTFDSVFIQSKRHVHGQAFQYRTDLEDVVRNDMRTILITRDPYSRLYSAFIDKIYLPNRGPLYSDNILAKSLGVSTKKIHRCAGNNISFHDFLNYIIRRAKRAPSLKSLDAHWRPVSVVCNPCFINPFAIVKQESFTDDVEYTLRQLNIDEKKHKLISYALHNRSADIGIEDLVRNFEFPLIKGRWKNRSCLTSIEIAFRLWHALQIQGLINKIADFPWQEVIEDSKTTGSIYLLKYITKAREKYPMTSELKRRQRKSYLVEAYRDIGRDTITELQTIYRNDFALYNYNLEPPTI